MLKSMMPDPNDPPMQITVGYAAQPVLSSTMHILYGVLLAISVLWPRYIFLPFAGVGVSPYTLGSFGLLVYALLVLFTNAAIRTAWINAIAGRPLLPILIVIHSVWQVIASALGDQPERSLALSLRDLLYLNSHFFIATVVFVDNKSLSRVPSALLYSVIIAALIGLYESVMATNFVEGLGLLKYSTGDDALLLSLVGEKIRDGAFRAQSVFSHPIVFGQIMAAFVPMGLALFSHGHGISRLFGLVAILTTLSAIGASVSRSSYVVVAASLLLYFILQTQPALRDAERNSLPIRPLLVTLCFGLLLILFGNQLIGGTSNEEASSTSSRLDMLAMTMAALTDNYLTGFGTGRAVYKAGLAGEDGLLTIDSLYMTIALDSGFIGLLIFGLLLLAAFRSSYRSLKAMVGIPFSVNFAACVAMVFSIAVGQISLSITDNLTFLYIAIALIHAVEVRSLAISK